MIPSRRHREAVPEIVQARDSSPACRAMDSGDTPRRVECGLNGAAGEPRAVPIRQKEGSLALGKLAAPPQRHVVGQDCCKLRSDRNQTALAELRGAHGQNAFRQIDVRQCQCCRFTEAPPQPWPSGSVDGNPDAGRPRRFRPLHVDLGIGGTIALAKSHRHGSRAWLPP